MAKAATTNKSTEATDDADENAPAGEETKQGFVKKLLGNKKLLIIAGAALLVLLLGGGAGAYFFLFRSAPQQTADTTQQLPATPPQVSFYDVPAMLVNIQTVDGTPAYLKLTVSLELDSDAEKPGIRALMPRLVDQFQSYLRELRLDDLKGSAGVLRVKEELLRRVNASAAPYHVRDVLLKEMVVQ
jgi:flagellar FliL protein